MYSFRKELLEKGEYAVFVDPKLPKPLSAFKWMVVYSVSFVAF